MKILIVNPIIYTSETRNIKKAPTIKDTMIYDLCLGFQNVGNEVVLAAAEDYKPEMPEEYPFEVIWLETKLKKLFPVNSLPFCPQIRKIAKSGNYDLIITSEVFSLNSLMLSLSTPNNLIVWHELAKHNRIMKKIPSVLWYNIVAPVCFDKPIIIPRSKEAKEFISKYVPENNLSNIVIDHGVNLDKFKAKSAKENYFIVSSQLIKRKRIDGIITNFYDYLIKYDKDCQLYILGEGDEKENLIALTKQLKIDSNVIFMGKLNHSELKEYLASAKAMLVNTEKDNNMVSIVEALACATPVITTTVPYNASYIKGSKLGIAKDNWTADDMYEIANNDTYIKNCLDYRDYLSCESKAKDFIIINHYKRKRHQQGV